MINKTRRKTSRNFGNFKKRNFKKRRFNNSRRRGRGGKQATFNPRDFINQNPVEQKEVVYVPNNTFNDFGFNSILTETLDSMGFKNPTPIQDQIIHTVFEGKDVIGLAETGTGKTAAFLLPIIERTLRDNGNKLTLILTPTRELAIQINDEFRKFSKGLKLFSTICVGGARIFPQIKQLRRKNHFIIGTPGRVMDLIKRKSIKPSQINTVVLDEADRMLDMGFVNDMRTILGQIPKERETLFFSATMTKEAEKLVDEFLRNPVTVSVKKRDITGSIKQDIIEFKKYNKIDILLDLLHKPEFKKVIIFGAMKRTVSKLADDIKKTGIFVESIHGDKTHGKRQMALKNFKSGKARVLVATDVAARGIHVDDVTHVINYDLPNTFDDYVHRIGRTGRSDKKGIALTFVEEKKKQYNRGRR